MAFSVVLSSYLLADGDGDGGNPNWQLGSATATGPQSTYLTNLTILRLKADARTALLTSKRTIDTNTKSRRDQLLTGGVPDPKPDDEKACVPP